MNQLGFVYYGKHKLFILYSDRVKFLNQFVILGCPSQSIVARHSHIGRGACYKTIEINSSLLKTLDPPIQPVC